MLCAVSVLILLAGGCGVSVGIPGGVEPIADAGVDQRVGPGSTVILDGSGSIGPSGEILTYSWAQISGVAVTLDDPRSATPTFIAPEALGTLVFRLTVTDAAGSGSSDTVEVVVTLTPENTPPIADAGAPQVVVGGQTVVLDGSGSSDPDGDPLTFFWRQRSGTVVYLLRADIPNPIFVAPSGNIVLVFELLVSDGRGGTDTSEVSVTISPIEGPTVF